MRVIVLASGSNGNCSYIENENMHILVDCGISYKMIKERLQDFGVDISQVNTLLITHEHVDHVAGIRVLLSKHPNIKVYMTEGTKRGMRSEIYGEIKDKDINFIKGFDVLEFENTKVTVLPLHHDARETVGYIFESNDKKVVYITDTGYIDQSYYELTMNADMYVIESNFDPELLYSSARPFDLKQRIAGDSGHLSNTDSALFLASNIGDKTKTVIYAHISEDCNFYSLPEIIRKAHKEVYDEVGIDYRNIDFVIGNRHESTGEFNI